MRLAVRDCFLATAALVVSGATAQAGIYFPFAASGTTSDGMGAFHVTGTFFASQNADGAYAVNGISGFQDGTPITSLLSAGSFGGNDNLLLYPGTPHLNLGGISYTAAGRQINIYGFGGYGWLDDAGNTGLITSFSLTPSRLFDFSYSSPGISASGQLTAFDGDTELLAAQITGQRNGAAITGLLAPFAFAGNDNLLHYPGPAFVDIGGISYQTSDGFFNLYNIDSPPVFFFGEIDANGNNIVLQQLSITEVVPEPFTGIIAAPALLLLLLQRSYFRRFNSSRSGSSSQTLRS